MRTEARTSKWKDRLQLAGLVAVLIGTAWALHAWVGWPHLPGSRPSLDAIEVGLQGTSLSAGAFLYIVGLAAWAAWFYLAASLALYSIASLAAALAPGNRHVASLRACLARVTLPAVRRLVEGAFLASIILNAGLRAAPALAQSAATPAAVTVSTQSVAQAVPDQPVESSDIEYTVQKNDTLWDIARRFYGDGEEYRQLLSANQGHQMADGQKFTEAGVIREGWKLRIPLPSAAIQVDQDQVRYVVQPDDWQGLSGISARLLGDPNRWGEIYQLNRGKARMPDGRVLLGPDVIWSGLPLTLPIKAPAAPPVDAPPAPVPQLVVEPPSPAVEAPSVEAPPVTPVVSEPLQSAPAEPATAAPGPSTDIPKVLAEAAAAAALAGAGTLLVRRRFRRSLQEPPPLPAEADSGDGGEGFAEAELSRAFSHRLHSGETDTAVLAARALSQVLRDKGLDAVSIVTANHGRASLDLTLEASLLDQASLAKAVPDIQRRLGCNARCSVTADRDVLLQLTGLKRSNLAALDRGESDGPPLIGLGLTAQRGTLYASWDQLGHVLIAGLPGGGAEVALTGLVAALACRKRPADLQLLTIGSHRVLPAAFGQLPHQRFGLLESSDERLAEALDWLRGELHERRISAGRLETPNPARPEIALVLSELQECAGAEGLVESILAEGATYGLRVIAATQRSEDIPEELLTQFDTRAALQMLDEDHSIRLLGQPDAAELRGGGDALVRVSGRRGLRLRLFRVADDHLQELTELMRAAYEPAAPPPLAAEQASADVSREPETAAAEPQAVLRVEITLDEPVVDWPEPDVVVLGEAPADIADAAEEQDAQVEAIEQVPLPLSFGTDTQLRVRCLGPMRVLFGEREVLPGPKGAKPWELLAYLATRPGYTASTEEVLATLWPKRTPQEALNPFYIAASRLRNRLASQVPELGQDVLLVDHNGGCALDPRKVSTDLAEFLELCRKAPTLPPSEAVVTYARAHALYGGNLLSGCEYEWMFDRSQTGVSEEERYRENFYAVTNELARLQLDAGHPELAVPLLKGLLREEPTLEDVVRSLYRCHAAMGDRMALLREHKQLQEALHQLFSEDGKEPDPDLCRPEDETIALFHALIESMGGDRIVEQQAIA